MSRRDLSDASGISITAIQYAEGEHIYKTSRGVALALADALALHVNEIAWPRGLSDLGRPAFTGTSRYTVVTITQHELFCPIHHLALPGTGFCDDCL